MSPRSASHRRATPFEAGPPIAVGAPAIVARQHTEIISEVTREFRRPLHRGTAKVRMQVAQMQDREAIESAWQIWKTYNVAPHLHIARVSLASPIGPRHSKRYLDHHLL
jgi:hypothetical protein